MKFFKPCSELAPYIESIWFIEHKVDAQEIRKIIPDGSCEFILNLGDPFQLSFDNVHYELLNSINLFFIRDRMSYLIQGARSKAMGVRIKPFALYILIGKALVNFETKVVSLASILPELNDKFLNLPSNELDAVDSMQNILLETFSVNRLRRHYAAEAIYKEIESKKGMISIDYLIEQLDISYKFCERLFLKYYGITPKKYIRYRRLSFALNEINKATDKPDFMAIVVKYGFHDQAHLIREFIDLSGVSPLSIYDDNDTLQKFYQNS